MEVISLEEFKKIKIGGRIRSKAPMSGLSPEEIVWTAYQIGMGTGVTSFKATYFGITLGRIAGKVQGDKIIWVRIEGK